MDVISNKLDNKNTKIHFIGVGGISMCSLAEIFLKEGFKVSGSDIHYSEDIKNLEKLGLEFFDGHHAKNITNADVVVFTAAIKDGNPELEAAKTAKKTLYTRSEILGFIMSMYKNSVAVAGTHGKTTVTSMIAYIFENLKYDPTILVGAHLDIIGGTMKHGKSDYFIAEACEYHRSFLDFNPFCQVILNVEPDHLDYYKDAYDYHSAYADFIKRLKHGGFIAACADDSDLMKILKNFTGKLITFSANCQNADIFAENIAFSTVGTSFDLYINEEKICTVKTKLLGMHNVLNILAAISCAAGFGIDAKQAVLALSDFTGADRRFELKGTCGGALVYDDYAHHPTEIRATVSAAAQMPHNRLICVYQPHTYTRTLAFFDEFPQAFKGVDILIFADIYAAREIDDGSVSSKLLCKHTAETGINALYLGGFENIANYVKQTAHTGDIVIIMGAGDIVNITPDILDSQE